MGLRCFHISSERLSLYADAELDLVAARRVERHLAACPRCLVRFESIRAIDGRVRALPAPELPERLRARVLAGLSLCDTAAVSAAPPTHRLRYWSLAPAAVVLLVVLLLPVLSSRSELEANESELTFSPATPELGTRVDVVYRPGSLLASETRLRLRARYLKADDFPMPGVGRQAFVAELERGEDGSFRGTIRLPDSVVFGAFAVEDPSGERVDSNARTPWELLVHGEDGRPLYEALEQRVHDHELMNADLSYEIALQATALHPDRVRAWAMLALKEGMLHGAALDSARASSRERLAEFDRILRPRNELDPEDETGMMRIFAREVGDTALARYWADRLLREAPSSIWGVQERLARLSGMVQADPARALPHFEELWGDAGSGQGARVYASVALSVAEQAGDATAVRRWVDRLAVGDPAEDDVGIYLAGVEGHRERAMELLRAQLLALGRVNHATRPLDRSVSEDRRARREKAGRVLATLGAELIEAGRTAAALDTLGLAMETGWDAPLFRRIAGLRIDAGDTVGAVAPLALAAADPLYGPELRDSVPALLGSRYDTVTWSTALRQSDAEMRRRVSVHEERRRVPAGVRLEDSEGRSVSLQELTGGRPTFIAYWSRRCQLSAMQIPHLQRVVADLRKRGYSVVTVSEAMTPDFERFLAMRTLDLPVYRDESGEIGRALGQYGWPNYFVLDGEGDLRFGPSIALEMIPAQMQVVETLR